MTPYALSSLSSADEKTDDGISLLHTMSRSLLTKWHREPGLISVQGMPVACQAPQIEMLEFSPVVPVYNEQEVLPTLCGAVRQALESRVRGSWEVIFVHDGSEDGTAPPLVPAVGKIPIFLNHSKYSSAYISLIILFLINNAFAHG